MYRKNKIQDSQGQGTVFLVLVGALIIALIIVAAGYWYVQKGNSNTLLNTKKQTTNQVTNTANTTDSLEKELNSIDLGNIESDLSDIDKDLQIL